MTNPTPDIVEASTPAATATWGGLPAAAPVGAGSSTEEWGIGDRTAEFAVPQAAGGLGVRRPARRSTRRTRRVRRTRQRGRQASVQPSR